MFSDVFVVFSFSKNRAQKGREYSHWIDLTLGIHFEAVISEIYRTEVRFCFKIDVFGVEKGTKRSSGPNTDVLSKTKRGARRLDMKNAGVKKSSSFIWTLVVKKQNGKGKRETPTNVIHTQR